MLAPDAPTTIPLDTLCLVPQRHAMMAFGFRCDARSRTFVPVTRELTVFTHGPSGPFTDAGYATPADGWPADSTAMTNAYEGGALSQHYLSVVLAATVTPSQCVRIIRAGDVADVDGRPCFPPYGGRVDSTSGQFADLWDACMLGAEVEALPQSTAAGAPPMKLGPASRMCSVRGGAFSRYVFNKDFLANSCAPGRQPNRIRFKFPAAIDSVGLRATVTVPVDGDYAVLDAAVYLDHVEGAMGGADNRFLFLDEAHAQKYAAFFRLRTAAERQRAMPGGGPPYL